jgi:hypothetical protein
VSDAQTFAFTLTDAQGQEHTYECAYHGPESGERLFLEITTLVIEPASALLGDDVDFAAMLGGDAKQAEGIDLSALAKAARSVLTGTDMKRLSDDLLKGAVRDGKDMADPVQRGQAFVRNYTEKYRAAFEIAKANGFFPRLG